MDAVLFLGRIDLKLKQLAVKTGYSCFEDERKVPLEKLIINSLIDLIVIDSRELPDGIALAERLRAEGASRRLPILFIPADEQMQNEIDKRAIAKLTVLKPNVEPAEVIGKMATELRLRKMRGSDPGSDATLSERNAALRDLTAHFAKELDDARAIQRSLLPHVLPTDERFELAVRYQPLAEVGGDAYFISTDSNGDLLLQVADVTGHGISAALLGSMSKLALSAVAQDDPAKLLEGANRLLTPQMPSGRFVTVVALAYDPRTGNVRSARAGHPPALVVHRSTGQVSELKGEGLPLGVLEESVYGNEQATLGIGDILVAYTDGITEACNRSNKMYGAQRLSEVLLKAPKTASAKEILDDLLKDFERFCDGRRLKDDVTIIVLNRRA
jgi:CheY-like chemotaxis protein